MQPGDTLPPIVPPGGAPIVSDAPTMPSPPVRVLQPAMLEPPTLVNPEEPDNLILRLQIAPSVGIVSASVRVQGASHPANLVHHAQISIDNNLAHIDFGRLRPLTRIAFTLVSGNHRLMIRLGGTWFQPEGVANVNFDNYLSNTKFPELVTEQVLLDNVAEVTDIESISFPANVVLRLTDGGVPFFFHRGDLRTAGVQVPDFGQQLALSLQGCEPVNGFCSIDVMAHSDAFGLITATQPRLVYRFMHNSLDGLTFAARTVTIPAESSVTFPLPLPHDLTITPEQPPVAAVTLGLVALGFGPLFAVTAGRRGAVVSARFQVAQAVVFAQPLTVAAVYLYLLRRTPKASLTLELRANVDGEPRGAVLATATVDTSGLVDNSFVWAPTTLDEPVAIAANSRLWIVLRADEGEVEWRGGDSPPNGSAALFSIDRGNTWRAHPLEATYVFLPLLPTAETPLMLQLEVGGERQDLVYAADAFPLNLLADSALVRGINAAIADRVAEGNDAALPTTIDLSLHTDSALPIQVTLTQFDVTYTQVYTEDA